MTPEVSQQELERMQGIKSMQVYSWKHMEAQGDWQGSLSLILVINMQFV